MTKQATLYARVSTDQQSEKGYSIPSQLKACRDYAERQGWKIVGEYADDCSGTIPVAHRPEGARLYRDIEQRQVDAVVLYTMDRAARDEDVLEFLIFKRDMKSKGVELHFCDSGKVADNPISGVIDYFKAAQASDERIKIRERTTRGKREKARNGLFVGGMPTAYGYKWAGNRDKARLVIDETEAAIVRRIYRLYTVGEDGQPPMKMHAIAVRLTEDGIPPPYGRGKSRSRGWYTYTVKAILTRRNYIGEFPNYGTTKIAHELALIDQTTWNAAQAKREQNKVTARRNAKREYLLSGIITCKCGRRFCGGARKKHNSEADYRYYKCIGQQVYNHLINCREASMLADQVETRVWDWFVGQLDEKTIHEGLKAREKKDKLELAPMRRDLAKLEKELERAERKIKKYMDAFGETDDETVAAEYQLTIKAMAKEKKALLIKQDRLVLALSGREISHDRQAAIKKSAERIRRKITGGSKPTFAQKRAMFELLDLKVKIEYQGDRRALFATYVLSADPAEIPESDESPSILSNVRRHQVLPRQRQGWAR